MPGELEDEMTNYPRRNESGETVWACCESSIGPTCRHRTEPTNDYEDRISGAILDALAQWGRQFGSGGTP